MTYMELVAELVRLREQKKITMARLARLMHTSESHVWRLEHGVSTARVATLARWCDVLGMEMDMVMHYTLSPKAVGKEE